MEMSKVGKNCKKSLKKSPKIPYILGNIINKPMGLLSEQNIFFGNKPISLCANKFFFRPLK